MHFECFNINLESAIHWYTLSAEQGDTTAQIRLGMLYEHGIGVEKDSAMADYWYAMKGQKIKRAIHRKPIVEVKDVEKLSKEKEPETKVPDMVCCICTVNVKNVLCLPCLHVSTCLNCTKDLLVSKNQCPICRGEIKQIVKMYL